MLEIKSKLIAQILVVDDQAANLFAMEKTLQTLDCEIYKAHIYKGYETGAVDFLFKPVNTDILLSKVKVFIELNLQKRELEQIKAEQQQSITGLERFKEAATLFEHHPDLIYSLDLSGHYLSANPAYERKMRIRSEDIEQQQLHFRQFTAQEQMDSMEHYFRLSSSGIVQ